MNSPVMLTLHADGVAEVMLNREQKMNALSGDLMHALVDVVSQLQTLPDVRAVVLHGAGRAFCAGIDTSRLGDTSDSVLTSSMLTERTHGIGNAFQHAVIGLLNLPVPVIAAVHGVAFGGGFQIALGADMRYVTPDARLSVMEIKWGLVPDMAGTWILPRLVRTDIVRELTYTGRIFSGDEALQMGLATRVCADPLAEAFRTARDIAGKSPRAIRANKRLINQALENGQAAQLLLESVEQDRLLAHPEQAETVRAQMEKRKPTFALGE